MKNNNIHGCDGSNCIGSYYEDIISHGTHVTGTIAASGNNNLDVVGVIPKGANLFGYNMFPDGAANTADSVMALLTCEDWLDRKKKVDPTSRMVINMSYGDAKVSSVERSVARKLYARGDILMVASSGNNQIDYPDRYFYPACEYMKLDIANLFNPNPKKLLMPKLLDVIYEKMIYKFYSLFWNSGFFMASNL